MTKKVATLPIQLHVNKNRASRGQCSEVRSATMTRVLADKLELSATKLKPTAKANDAKPGLRFNIIEAVRKSANVGEALSAKVFGKPGSKHDSLPYTIKKVDLFFTITNGFVEVVY